MNKQGRGNSELDWKLRFFITDRKWLYYSINCNSQTTETMSVECYVAIMNDDHEDGIALWKTVRDFVSREQVKYENVYILWMQIFKNTYYIWWRTTQKRWENEINQLFRKGNYG